VGLVVDKVAPGHVLSRVLRFSPVSFILRNYSITKKRTKITIIFIFITGLRKKPQGCGAPLASAVVPFSTKKKTQAEVIDIILE
jgi:hypothetical protein